MKEPNLLFHCSTKFHSRARREKCPNTEFFLVPLQENTEQK